MASKQSASGSSALTEVERILQILEKNAMLKQRVMYRIRELKRSMGEREKTYSVREQKEIRLQKQQEQLEKKKT